MSKKQAQQQTNHLLVWKQNNKLPFVIHGSANSVDKDVIYLVPEPHQLPSAQQCHYFCHHDTDAHLENRNVAVIRNGMIVQCYKGTCDALNNQILTTFAYHEQPCFDACPVSRVVRRQVVLKVVRSIRQILGFVATQKSGFYAQAKQALHSPNFVDRVTCFQQLDFAQVFVLPLSKAHVDTLKSVAFQLLQTLAQFSFVPLYSKDAIVQYDKRVDAIMYRKYDLIEQDLTELMHVLNEYVQLIVKELIPHITVTHDKQGVNFIQWNNTEKTNAFAIECLQGIHVHVFRERTLHMGMQWISNARVKEHLHQMIPAPSFIASIPIACYSVSMDNCVLVYQREHGTLCTSHKEYQQVCYMWINQIAHVNFQDYDYVFDKQGKWLLTRNKNTMEWELAQDAQIAKIEPLPLLVQFHHFLCPHAKTMFVCDNFYLA